jgi:hypothetical protein
MIIYANFVIIPYVSHRESELQSLIYGLAPNRVLRSRYKDFYVTIQNGGVDVTHLGRESSKTVQEPRHQLADRGFSPKYRPW